MARTQAHHGRWERQHEGLGGHGGGALPCPGEESVGGAQGAEVPALAGRAHAEAAEGLHQVSLSSVCQSE